jgi:SAM-dependent methyltransferase
MSALGEIRRVLRPGGTLFASVWDRDQPRFHESESADVGVPWRLPDGTKVSRFYHLFREGELESLIIESGLRGERFFRARSNRFAEATKHG